MAVCVWLEAAHGVDPARLVPMLGDVVGQSVVAHKPHPRWDAGVIILVDLGGVIEVEDAASAVRKRVVNLPSADRHESHTRKSWSESWQADADSQKQRVEIIRERQTDADKSKGGGWR